MSRSGGEKGLRLNGARNLVFLSSETGMSGNFLGCIKGFKYPFKFTRERGISLETLQRDRASSRDGGGTTWFFLSCVGILELRRGIQDASCVGPGKSNLQSSCEGELGIALESLQGK